MLHTFANQLTGLQLSTETPADSNTFLWEDQMLSGCVLTDKFINTRASWAAVQLCVEVHKGDGVLPGCIYTLAEPWILS